MATPSLAQEGNMMRIKNKTTLLPALALLLLGRASHKSSGLAIKYEMKSVMRAIKESTLICTLRLPITRDAHASSNTVRETVEVRPGAEKGLTRRGGKPGHCREKEQEKLSGGEIRAGKANGRLGDSGTESGQLWLRPLFSIVSHLFTQQTCTSQARHCHLGHALSKFWALSPSWGRDLQQGSPTGRCIYKLHMHKLLL